jgi:hypothetical protein
MSEKDKPVGSTAEVALTRMFAGSAQATEADQLRAMDATIRTMARDRYTNPQQLRAPDNTKVANAPEVVTAGEGKRGKGWQEEKSLRIHSAKGSSEEALIDRLAEKFVGGPNESVK